MNYKLTGEGIDKSYIFSLNKLYILSFFVY